MMTFVYLATEPSVKVYETLSRTKLQEAISHITMNHGASLALSTAFGLLTGIGHGFYAHQHDLPLSLSEQVVQVISINLSGQE